MLVLLPVAFAACSSKQNSATTTSRADSVIVSLEGISDFKINMREKAVEKLLKRKLALPNISSPAGDMYLDTVFCKYKDIDYKLVFTKESQSDSSVIISLSEATSQSPLLKTHSGIGIGDDIHKIIDAYSDDYRIEIMPGYNYNDNPPTRIKSKSSIWLSNNKSDKTIIFHMDNNKVESISVSVAEDD